MPEVSAAGYIHAKIAIDALLFDAQPVNRHAIRLFQHPAGIGFDRLENQPANHRVDLF